MWSYGIIHSFTWNKTSLAGVGKWASFLTNYEPYICSWPSYICSWPKIGFHNLKCNILLHHTIVKPAVQYALLKNCHSNGDGSINSLLMKQNPLILTGYINRSWPESKSWKNFPNKLEAKVRYQGISLDPQGLKMHVCTLGVKWAQISGQDQRVRYLKDGESALSIEL